MMQRTVLRVLVFSMLGISALTSAFAETKQEKISRLVAAQGLLEGWTAQIEAGKVASKAQGQQMLSQVLANLNPNEEFQFRFAAAFNQYLEDVQSPWTPEYLVDVYASYYGPQFSEDELNLGSAT